MIDDLGKKSGFKTGSINFIKCPFKTGSTLVTDIKQSENDQKRDSLEEKSIELVLAFSNGKIWILEPFNLEKGGYN